MNQKNWFEGAEKGTLVTHVLCGTWVCEPIWIASSNETWRRKISVIIEMLFRVISVFFFLIWCSFGSTCVVLFFPCIFFISNSFSTIFYGVASNVAASIFAKYIRLLPVVRTATTSGTITTRWIEVESLWIRRVLVGEESCILSIRFSSVPSFRHLFLF